MKDEKLSDATISEGYPAHIAIIMDGNGRWANLINKERIFGHRKGVEAVDRTVRFLLERKIKYLTLYAFSYENWKRSEKEIVFLMKTLDKYLIENLDFMMERGIRLNTIGELYMLPARSVSIIDKIKKETSNNENMVLTLALSYGSRQEILRAVKSISSDLKSGTIDEDDIDIDFISSRLYTADLPDPDLLVRTSGEIRLSNFLLWQLAYTEFYFLEKLWPDFDESDIQNAIDSFLKRERRFGKAVDSRSA